MLSVLLLILKIIGITIAVILGILLFVILLLLFVPFRYKVRAEKKAETKAKGRISWLFGIIYVKIEYVNNKLLYVVRVFGYPVLTSDPKKKRRKRIKNTAKKRKRENKRIKGDEPRKDKQTKPLPEADKREKTESECQKVMTVSKKEPLPSETAPSRTKAEERKGEDSDKDASPSKARSFFDKINKLRGLSRSIKQKISDMLTMIKDLLRRTGLVRGFLFDKRNKPGFTTLFGMLRKVFRHISPRKYKVSLYFGFDDPSLTGKVLGGICAVYPQILGKIDLKPEFEHKVLELTLYARGRVRMITLLIWTLQLILKKEFKYVIKEFKQLKEEL